jgi:hypothetical protein
MLCGASLATRRSVSRGLAGLHSEGRSMVERSCSQDFASGTEPRGVAYCGHAHIAARLAEA